MAQRKNNTWIWWVIGGFLLLRHVATGGVLRSLFLSPSQLAQMYRAMLEAGTNTTYTVERDGETILWHIDLARSTKDYEAVKNAYANAYGRSLSNDLIAYFGEMGYIHLSEYVAELQKNGQVMLL